MHNQKGGNRVFGLIRYYLMAQEAGMKMMPSIVVEGEKEAHFLTERFDRKGNEKIHIQTLAAMNPAADSYESLFDTACRIGIVPVEMQRLFLSMTMNVLGGNVEICLRWLRNTI